MPPCVRVMAESGSPSILVVTGIKKKKKDLIMVSREVVVSGQKLGREKNLPRI